MEVIDNLNNGRFCRDTMRKDSQNWLQERMEGKNWGQLLGNDYCYVHTGFFFFLFSNERIYGPHAMEQKGTIDTCNNLYSSKDKDYIEWKMSIAKFCVLYDSVYINSWNSKMREMENRWVVCRNWERRDRRRWIRVTRGIFAMGLFSIWIWW